ncbi:MAG: hypothetical protein N0E38_22090, partial [Candidatus Thiodiazotropha endolucinida]|nr:hypothetical protein [Candidatus Thiodiazotropha taylori]MCW4351616.1 hypothetical protein [Candidatus Thiodiazotropha endolucinida]
QTAANDMTMCPAATQSTAYSAVKGNLGGISKRITFELLIVGCSYPYLRRFAFICGDSHPFAAFPSLLCHPFDQRRSRATKVNSFE